MRVEMCFEEELEKFDDFQLLDHFYQAKKFDECLFLLSRRFEALPDEKASEIGQCLIDLTITQKIERVGYLTADLDSLDLWSWEHVAYLLFYCYWVAQFLALHHPQKFAFIQTNIILHHELKRKSVDDFYLGLLFNVPRRGIIYHQEAILWAIEEGKPRSLRKVVRMLDEARLIDALMRSEQRGSFIYTLTLRNPVSLRAQAYFFIKMSSKLISEKSSAHLENRSHKK